MATTRGKIRYFCTCHGYSRGSRQDKRAHPSGGWTSSATYEARMRVGNKWFNRQQIARGRGR